MLVLSGGRSVLLMSVIFSLTLTCFCHDDPFGESMDKDDEEYVYPSDMGSYQHAGQRNKNGQRNYRARPDLGTKRRSGNYKESTPEELSKLEDELIRLEISLSQEKGDELDTPEFLTGHGGSIGMTYLKRLVASILWQLQVRSHNFGPKEAITIDLQAEISHEDLTILNTFINSKSDSTQRQLNKIDNIVSRLFHVVSPPSSLGFYEYFRETIGFGMLYSVKFWLVLVSACVIFLVLAILLIQTYSAQSPGKVMVCGLTVFFIVSCIWVFAGLYESNKAVNAARLHQYQAMPKDCDFDNLGYFETVGYYIRVRVFRYEDRCEMYHKEILMDPFYKASPVEAISETSSKFLFHSMEYIGDKVGKFFGGVVNAVPFWLQPILLILVFLFVFIGLFGYAIHTPFLSIEPAHRVLPQLEDSPHRAPIHNAGAHQQIIERPSASIVRAALKDASTSTDDLEDYIRNSEFIHEDRPSSNFIYQLQNYLGCLQTFCISVWNHVLCVLSFIFREVPAEPENDEIVPVVDEILNPPRIFDPVPVIERLPERDDIQRMDPPDIGFPRPEIIVPDPNANRSGEEVLNIAGPSRRKNSIPSNGAYGWVYVDDNTKSSNPSGSEKSSSESLNFEGGGDIWIDAICKELGVGSHSELLPKDGGGDHIGETEEERCQRCSIRKRRSGGGQDDT